MLSATQCKIKFTFQTHCISNVSQYALRGIVVSYVLLLFFALNKHLFDVERRKHASVFGISL